MAEKVGVELAVDNYSTALSQVTNFGKSLTALGVTATAAAAAFRPFDAAVSASVSGVAKVSGAFTGAIGSVTRFAGSVGGNIFEGLVHGAEEAASVVGELGKKVGEVALEVGKESVSLAGDYQASMNRVQFITGATTAEMGEYNKAAIEIGKTTTFSSKSAAEGFALLAKEGYRGKEVIDLNRTAANAAMIANVDLDTSIRNMTTVMMAFGVPAEQSDHILDEMVKTTQMGKLNFDEFQQVMARTGSVAKEANQSFAMTSSAMLALTGTGMTANLSAQKLSSTLVTLEKPNANAEKMIKQLGLTVYDSSGKMNSLSDITRQLTVQTSKMTDEERNFSLATIFGKANITTINDLMHAHVQVMKDGKQVTLEGADALDYWNSQIENSQGTTEKAGEVLKSGYNYQLKQLKGSIEEAKISIGQAFLPALTSVVGKVTEVTNKFIDWSQGTKTLSKIVTQFTSDLSKAFKAVTPDLLALKLGFTGEWIPTQVKTLPAFFALLAHDTRAAIATIIDVIEGFKKGLTGEWVPKEVHTLPAFFATFGHDIVTVFDTIVKAVDAFKRGFLGTADGLMGAAKTSNDGIHKYLLNPLTELGTWTRDSLIPAVQGIARTFGEVFKAVEPFLGKLFEIYQAVSPIKNIIDIIAGFAKGGFEGGLYAIGTAVVRIGDAFGIDLRGAVMTVTEFIQNKVIPAFQAISDFITTKVVPAVMLFAQFVMERVIPALGQIGDFIMNKVVPAVGQFAAWIGEHLIPVVLSVASQITDKIIPAIGQLAEWFTSKALPALGQFAQFIGEKVVPVIGTVIDVIANKVIPVLGDWISFIIGKVIPILGDWISILVSALMPVIAALGDFITNKLVPAFNTVADFMQSTLIPAFNKVADFVSTKVMPVLAVLAQYLGGALAMAFNTLSTLVSGVWNAIVIVIGTAWNSIKAIFDIITGILTGDFGGAWKGLQTLIGGAWDGITKLIGNAWDTISGIFGKMVDGVKSTLGPAIDGLKPLFEGVFKAVGTAIDTVVGIWNGLVDTIKQGAKVIGDVAKGDWGAAWDDLTGKTRSSGDLMTNMANNTRDQIVKALDDVAPRAKTSLDNVNGVIKGQNWYGSAYSLGQNVGAGVAAGIDSQAGAAARSAAAMITNAINAAKNAGKISSPSKVASDQIGKPIAEGVALGILQNAKQVMDAMTHLMGGVTTAALDAAIKQTETLTKVADATKAIFESLSKLRDYVQIGDGPIKKFSADVFSLAAEFYNASKNFTTKMLEATDKFSDSVAKVGTGAAAAFGALEKLKDYSFIGKDKIYAFGQDVFSLSAEFYNNSTKFNTDMLASTEQYSDTVGKVSAGAGAAFVALSNLTKYSQVGLEAIHNFSSDVLGLTAEFYNNSMGFSDQMLESATKYSDTVARVSAAAAVAFPALSNLKKYSQVGLATIHDFSADILGLVAEFSNNSMGFDQKMLAAASTYADAAAKVVAVVGAGVTNFEKLQKYKTVAHENITNFVNDLNALISQTITAAQQFDAKSVTATAVWGESIGKLTNGLKAGMDLFDKLRDYKQVASTAIRAFVADIDLTVSLAMELVKRTNSDLMVQVGAFGDAVNKLFGGFNSAMSTFQGLEKYKAIPSNVIKNFISEIEFTVGLAEQMVKETDTNLLDETVSFFEAVGKVFTNMKTAMDTLKAMEAYQEVPPNMVKHIIKGMDDANKLFYIALQRADTFGVDATEFGHKIDAAAKEIDRAVGLAASAAAKAAAVQVPSAPNVPSAPAASHAKGGIHSGGAAVVGEAGAELMQLPNNTVKLVVRPTFFPDLPRGTKVFNAQETREMIKYPMSAGQMMMQTYNQQSYQNNYNLSLSGMGMSSGNVMSDFAIMQLMGA